MGHLPTDSPQSASLNRHRLTVGEGHVGMARTTAICKHCGSLIYIPETRTIRDFVCPRCHGQLRDSDEDRTRIGFAEPIQSSCPQCQAVLHIPAALAGKHVFCIACGCRLLVALTVQIDPAPQVPTEPLEKEPPTSVAKTADDDEMIRVTCRCGKRLKADPTAAGRTTGCPRCGLPVTFPDEPSEGDEPVPISSNCQPSSTTTVPPTSTESPASPPLLPHEAAVVARDKTIDAALHCLVYGLHATDGQPAELEEDDASLFLNIAHAAWLWPVAAALTATCIMIILMKTFVAAF